MKIELTDNRRLFVFMAVVFMLFCALIIQLANLTIVQGTEYADKASSRTKEEIITTGARGIIMDCNGVPLAYDEKSYDVIFYKDPSKNSSDERAHFTLILMRAIEIIRKNGGVINDNFSIKRNEEGLFEFDFGTTDLVVFAKREQNWRRDLQFLDKYKDGELEGEYKRNPEDIYTIMRTRYQIPPELGYEEARLLLSIW